MPIPGTQEIRKPLLEAFKGEAPHNFAINDFLELTAGYFGVDLNDLSSGDKNILKSRITEAKNDLKKNNLISNPSKNTYMITTAGTEILDENPDVITDEYLASRKFKTLSASDTLGLEIPETVMTFSESSEPVAYEVDENLTGSSEFTDEESETEQEDLTVPETDGNDDLTDSDFEPLPEESDDENTDVPPEDSEDIAEADTPEEFTDVHSESEPEEPEYQPEPEPEVTEVETETDDAEFLRDVQVPQYGIDEAVAKHNADLADELLMRTAGLPSDRFEMLVIDLLSKMGYFAFRTARYTTESSGSDLIHGVILDNKTGANIYIQARKLSPDKTVGRADIQDFIDELSDKGGKGIFATTAAFSENARILADDERIMLIDGEKLASLMITHDFCVNTEKVYEVKALDSEAFQAYEQ